MSTGSAHIKDPYCSICNRFGHRTIDCNQTKPKSTMTEQESKLLHTMTDHIADEITILLARQRGKHYYQGRDLSLMVRIAINAGFRKTAETFEAGGENK